MNTKISPISSANSCEIDPGKEAIARLAAIVNSSEDAIIGLDLNNVITSWNRGAEKIFSYTAQESIGKSMAFLIPSERLNEEDHILNKILSGDSITHFETERLAKGGACITVSIKVSAILGVNNVVIGLSKIIRDITKQKKSAQELLNANKELIFQNKEKVKRAAELAIANQDLVYQNIEKEKRVEELIFQNEEKAKRAAELVIANQEKAKRLHELVVANKELLYESGEKAKRADELVIANEEKTKRVDELILADLEKAKRSVEMLIANEEKAKRVHELMMANDELIYQNEEKEKRADELAIANMEKIKRADELVLANIEKAKSSVELEESINKARQTEHQMLSSLNALSLARDNETGNHVIRTQHYVKVIATRLLEMGKYPDQINEKIIELMFDAAPLHDLGKIGIPDAILQKPGKLTQDEWVVMKTHAIIGENVMSAANLQASKTNQLFTMAIAIAGGHHERWDGAGYPRGFKDEAIPLAARIMAIADVYDALVSKRVYKEKWTYEDAIQEILSLRGVQFDPVIVDAFKLEESKFNEIAKIYCDD